MSFVRADRRTDLGGFISGGCTSGIRLYMLSSVETDILMLCVCFHGDVSCDYV